MPRLPAEIRISLKNAWATHRIELIRQPVGKRYWISQATRTPPSCPRFGESDGSHDARRWLFQQSTPTRASAAPRQGPPNSAVADIPPVYGPFAFTCRPVSFMLGAWPRSTAVRPTPKSSPHTTTTPRMRKTTAAKADAFITACRILRNRLPLSAGRGSQTFTRESLQPRLKRLSGGKTLTPPPLARQRRVRYVSMQNYRG